MFVIHKVNLRIPVAERAHERALFESAFALKRFNASQRAHPRAKCLWPYFQSAFGAHSAPRQPKQNSQAKLLRSRLQSTQTSHRITIRWCSARWSAAGSTKHPSNITSSFFMMRAPATKRFLRQIVTRRATFTCNPCTAQTRNASAKQELEVHRSGERNHPRRGRSDPSLAFHRRTSMLTPKCTNG